MGTVLFAPETFSLAETTRMLEIAKVMRAQHDCVFLSYSDRFADLIDEAGFDQDRLLPRLTEEQADQLLAADQGRSLRHPFTVGMMRQRVRGERRLIAEVEPDAVVVGTTLSLLISARAEGIPLVWVKPFALSRPHLDHAGPLPVLAGSNRVARTVNRIAGRLAPAVLDRVTVKPRFLSRIAGENGVRLSDALIDAIDADLNLVTALESELAGYRLPSHYEAVGPVYARLDRPVPPMVRELAESPRPLVYAAMGSSATRPLVLRMLRGFEGLGVDVIAPVLEYLRPGDAETLPHCVHVTAHLPAHRLAGLIDLSVIHGGEGTVQTACLSGVPFLGTALQAEQAWNLDQCVRRGHAIRLSPRQLGGADFPRAVRAALTDPAMRRAAAEVADRHRRADGPRTAAAAVERTFTQHHEPESVQLV